ncbi:MAG TPA: DNA repair protein RadA, partial [Alphaproteobacteria bacterium]|nr:DNA repair protein RadA [Alphaproteobacteria bacterium]
CGGISAKWQGQCPHCSEWNTMVEETVATNATAPGAALKSKSGRGRQLDLAPLDAKTPPPPRRQTGISEFDRVCGGGLVAGGCLLIGGDPGIGKSTLLLQVTAQMATTTPTLYITGEESLDQVRLRAERLGVIGAPLTLAAETDLTAMLHTLKANDYGLVIIDSIQTVHWDQIESTAGTVSQVRACAGELIRMAKQKGFTLMLVGHVTKEGNIAGPRVLEHMVDCVLYFEGDRNHQFRILRTVKNRFGATDEIGVFAMTQMGLQEVPNPSALFLGERDRPVSGTAVFAGMEGTRPLLVEIQALVAPTGYGTPRRAVVGWDSARLSMILAVLESRAGVNFSQLDVYLNIAGGLRITEPAADLAVAAALISAYTGDPLPQQQVIVGEVGLSGEIRPVSQMDLRLKESAKLGFTSAITPPLRDAQLPNLSIAIKQLRELRQLAQPMLQHKAA